MRDVEKKGRPIIHAFGMPLTRRMVDVILAMCECQLSMNAAAKMLGIKEPSLEYHVRTIETHTGLRMKDFFDAVELYNLCWDEYPHLIAEIAEERFVGRRVPMKYTH